jgi:hypothetical protein
MCLTRRRRKMVEIANIINSDVIENKMAALSGIENEVYRVQQKVKKQQLTLMDMWKRWTKLHF